LLIFAAVLGAACSRAPKNEEAIRQAVVEHLQKNTGLDLSAMTVEVTKVDFRGKEADATIAFKPKNMPEGGMSMNYTLESDSGRWQVKKRAASGADAANPHGAAPDPAAATQLPPGHPPTGGAAGQGARGQLPPGHPPVSQPKPETGSSAKTGSTTKNR
jgi:hypothetical protein